LGSQGRQSAWGTQKVLSLTLPGTSEMKSAIAYSQVWSAKQSNVSTQLRRQTP
jgi:hypothetical protein